MYVQYHTNLELLIYAAKQIKVDEQSNLARVKVQPKIYLIGSPFMAFLSRRRSCQQL